MQELLNLYTECHTKWLNYPPCEMTRGRFSDHLAMACYCF
jgi:hypothetical protein